MLAPFYFFALLLLRYTYCTTNRDEFCTLLLSEDSDNILTNSPFRCIILVQVKGELPKDKTGYGSASRVSRRNA